MLIINTREEIRKEINKIFREASEKQAESDAKIINQIKEDNQSN